MHEALLAAFQSTHYLVCVDACEWEDIGVDRPLPAALRSLVVNRAWGVITAWNPQAVARPEAENLARQRVLHSALGRIHGAIIYPAIGIGSRWHEPSLFVIGAIRRRLDALARQYGQLGYVHGRGRGDARLRLLD